MEKPVQEHPHDLVSYRDTGELSDLTVLVDGDRELALHRFPLYIKSDYFRQRASESRISLPARFPGGSACFELVADFCYGKRLDIGLDNCVQLNAAAKVLGMTGRGNLSDLTDRYLDEILRTSQHTRSMAPVVELLAKATAIGEGDGDGDGEGEGDSADPTVRAIAERCFSTLLDAWTRQQAYGLGLVGDRLLRLPLAWFARLIAAGSSGDSDRQRRALADLSTRYLHRVFLRDARLEKRAEKAQKDADRAEQAAEKEEDAAAAAAAADAENYEEKEKAGSDAEADEAAAPSQLTRSASGRSGGSWPKRSGRHRDADREAKDEEADDDSQFVPREPAGQVLDRVILALPEATPLAEVISADWIQRALKISEKSGCQCRGRLLQLAGNSLHKFRPEELHQMTSPVLCDIVGSSARNKGVQPEVLACVIDNHLLDLAREGNLDPDDFVKLAGSVPVEFRTGHDTLYEAVETLLTSSGDDSIPDEKRQEIIALVDLSRCDVETLQRAQEKGVLPVKSVCEAAIELAKKLRQQLDSRAGGSGGPRLRSLTQPRSQYESKQSPLLLDARLPKKFPNQPRQQQQQQQQRQQRHQLHRAFVSLPARTRFDCYKIMNYGDTVYGRTRPGFISLFDDIRSGGSRYGAVGTGGRRFDSLPAAAVGSGGPYRAAPPHQFYSSGSALGGSTVHYADPYGYRDDDSLAEPQAVEPFSTGRYSAHDYDVDLLLLEAERTAQQQQQRSANYSYYPAQTSTWRSRKW